MRAREKHGELVRGEERDDLGGDFVVVELDERVERTGRRVVERPVEKDQHNREHTIHQGVYLCTAGGRSAEGRGGEVLGQRAGRGGGRA